MTKNIAIFASGSGSNAEKIITDFESTDLHVKVIFTNNPNAFVIERAKKLNVPCVIFSRENFKTDTFLKQIEVFEINYIVLAGFLWKVPAYLIKAFPDKIINIHPALLPKYGGKGMYGSHVHEAVVANKETETGITIHLVNEHYDEGRILFQAKCEVLPIDDAAAVAAKIHLLEYTHFPNVVKEYIG
jgi:phosphoribosylglycinamide formyltransferase 1